MEISRSAYYDAPPVAPDDTALVEAMSAIRDAFERYGWRRMQAALRQQGLVVNHKKVKRLMRGTRSPATHASAICGDDRQRPPPPDLP
jgi:putative transposase